MDASSSEEEPEDLEDRESSDKNELKEAFKYVTKKAGASNNKSKTTSK